MTTTSTGSRARISWRESTRNRSPVKNLIVFWVVGNWLLSYTNIGAILPDQGYQFLDSDDDTNSESSGFSESTKFLIKGLFRTSPSRAYLRLNAFLVLAFLLYRLLAIAPLELPLLSSLFWNLSWAIYWAPNWATNWATWLVGKVRKLLLIASKIWVLLPSWAHQGLTRYSPFYNLYLLAI